ncbi:unnamed protein product [Schistosoma curassoni]|uniref:Vesicle-fusing ATPase n=1 Tax=Schistosoma curassoni TaxID=6186 RepID=A0A183JLL6_9TREM|nr:unnamed protein product [Schistosoma curassoni]
MAVRKLTYAPNEPGQQPSAELSRDFLMSVGSLRVEATLDKNVRVFDFIYNVIVILLISFLLSFLSFTYSLLHLVCRKLICSLEISLVT